MGWFTNYVRDNIGEIIGAGAGLAGQVIASGASSDAADQSVEAAKIAAESARFKPYGVTTGFGSSYFNPVTQQAAYQLDPALAAYRDTNLTGAAMVADQLGATGLDPTQQAQNYYNQAQNIMAPQRAQQQTQMQQDLFGSGRLGMRLAGEASGAGRDTGMYQPDALGYNRAQELANQKLAMDSRTMAQQEIDQMIARSQGMFSYGMGVEEMGMTPLRLGAELGGMASSAGANAGSLMQSGLNAAANARANVGMGWGDYLGGLGQSLGQMKWNGG